MVPCSEGAGSVSRTAANAGTITCRLVRREAWLARSVRTPAAQGSAGRPQRRMGEPHFGERRGTDAVAGPPVERDSATEPQCVAAGALPGKLGVAQGHNNERAVVARGTLR